MSKITIFIASSIIFLVLASSACSGPHLRKQTDSLENSKACQSGEVTVWGEAPILSSLSATRAKAKQDACRRAVEKCIGAEVASATGVSDGQSILNEIFTQARGICQHDQALEEQQYKLDTIKMLRVFYRFTIKRADIRDKIDLLQELVGNPKVMVLIREVYNLPKKKKVEDYTSQSGFAAQLLREYLISKGYRVIDATKLKKHLKKQKAFIGQGQSEKISEKLKDAALQAGADILIIGNITASAQTMEALRGVGLKSYRATGSVSLVSLWGSSRILGEYSKSEPGAQVTDYAAARVAISAFARGKDQDLKLAKGLALYTDQRLRAEWITITQNNRIEMVVFGLSPKAAIILRENLKEATSVKNINELTSSAKKVVWELTYPGRSFALADTINFYQDNPKIFSVLRRPKCSGMKVIFVRRGEIRLRFTKGCS